jgi:hypothetical protein
MPLTHPTLLLRIEGLALLSGAVAFYAHRGESWLLFALLLFAPDVSMLGYLAGPRVGAATYNLAHTTTLPIALGIVGLALDSTTLIAVAAIWLAHVGLDRALAYGLKFPTHFTDTHLGARAPQTDVPAPANDRR